MNFTKLSCSSVLKKHLKLELVRSVNQMNDLWINLRHDRGLSQKLLHGALVLQHLDGHLLVA